MVKKILFSSLLILIVASFFAGCGGTATTTTAPTTTAATSATPTATAQANWWDKFGEPEYGGTITLRASSLTDQLDTWYFPPNAFTLWLDNMLMESWLISKEEWPVIRAAAYFPDKYAVPNLAESWETPDALTVILHLRQGVKWQDKPPTNGREFTAEDVIYHYDRIMGTGHGFTKGSPFAGDRLTTFASVTATEKYTVVIKFKAASVNNFTQLKDCGVHNYIVPRESVEAGLKDWKNAAGTGPFILTDYSSGSSMTLSKNPNYFGVDERHPKNKIPYVDTVKVSVIADTATAVAAMRTGKIDMLGGAGLVSGLAWQQSQTLAKSNPELLMAKYPAGGSCIEMRVDKAPFTDIKVRKALQLAIDLPLIAENFYGGTSDKVPAGLLNPVAYKGIAVPYDQWPKELQAEYSYNVEGAKKLLADAGLPNGFKTNIVVATTADLQLLQGIQSFFSAIGVDMEIRTMDPPTQSAFIRAMKHDQMTTSSAATTWPPNIAGTMKASFNHTSNFSGHTDQVFDALCMSLNTATTQEQTNKILADIDRYFLQQHWAVLMVPYYYYNIWEPYLKGYDGEGIGFYGSTQSYARMWIDQKLKTSMGR